MPARQRLVLGGSGGGCPGGDRFGDTWQEVFDDLVPCGVHLRREAADGGLKSWGRDLDTVLDPRLYPDAGGLDSGLTPLLRVLGRQCDSGNGPAT